MRSAECGILSLEVVPISDYGLGLRNPFRVSVESQFQAFSFRIPNSEMGGGERIFESV